MSETTLPKPDYRVLRLEAQNIKRLHAIDITPDRHVVGVGGGNDQGKTTTLECIHWALAGAGVIQEMPIRTGQTKASIRVDLGSIIVTRTFSTSGGSKLTVEAADGTPIRQPQTLLDELHAKIAFDPGQFMRLKPQEQRATLSKLVGIDFTVLDAERAKVYTQRTELNRQSTQVEAQIAARPHHPGVPAELVSVADLVAQQDAARKANSDAQSRLSTLRDKWITAASARQVAEQSLSDARAMVERLEGELARAKEAAAECEGNANLTAAQAAAHQETFDMASIKVELQDEAAIGAQIAAVSDTNEKVRANLELRKLQDSHNRLRGEIQTATARIDSIDAQKEATLKAAQFPLAGLGFSDSGVTFNGVPFEQAGSAVRLLASVRIAHLLNPRFPVILVRDAALVDPANMDVLTAYAREQNIQIWLELVGEGAHVNVVIEDGTARKPQNVE